MKKKIVPFLAAGALIIVVLLFMFLSSLIEKYTPTKDRQELSDYYALTSEDEAAIVLNDEVIETKGRVINGVVYLDYNFIHDNINSRFYWDANENKLLYATPTDLITVNAESDTYTITKDSQSFGHIIVKAYASTAYVAIDFVKQYSDFSYTVCENPNRILLTTQWGK